MTPQGGSHPSIRFEHLPVVPGVLHGFDGIRPRLLSEVTSRTLADLERPRPSLELLVGEALYQERSRLKRFKPNTFTKARADSDRHLWNGIHAGLLRPAVERDRSKLLKQIVEHYAEEIGGHFDPAVYRFATRAVPWGFSWLLNAASVRRFLPWGMTQSLQSRLTIVGEVPALQRLASKGTILLVPTHQSNIDSLLVGYLIYLMRLPPFAYGAGLNLFTNPIFSFFMGRLGAYTVDRQKGNAIYKNTLRNYSTVILKEGVHSIFFPGGGRSRSGAIESHLKLGLLGTGLEAQIEATRSGSPKPNVYVVPMVMSYHFVLEAASLIEAYLLESGRHRFIPTDTDPWQPWSVLPFFWKLFSSRTGITARVGRAMDIFGNFVDEEGRSIGPNGTTIDPIKWLTTSGELQAETQRDREYTRELGLKLTERFHAENTVLGSHLVAFSYFETLRARFPELDLYRFLRLSLEQRTLSWAEFAASAERHRERVVRLEREGGLFVAPEVKEQDWIRKGAAELGLFHGASVVKIQDPLVSTDDMNLLYYYRNRLSGYGLSTLPPVRSMTRHEGYDEKGFLA